MILLNTTSVPSQKPFRQVNVQCLNHRTLTTGGKCHCKAGLLCYWFGFSSSNNTEITIYYNDWFNTIPLNWSSTIDLFSYVECSLVKSSLLKVSQLHSRNEMVGLWPMGEVGNKAIVSLQQRQNDFKASLSLTHLLFLSHTQRCSSNEAQLYDSGSNTTLQKMHI